jgi:hypothetical protein
MSVEKLPIRASHRAVGTQARKTCRNNEEEGFGSTVEDKRLLLQPVIGGFARDDDIVNMAFPQAGPADADKPGLLL